MPCAIFAAQGRHAREVGTDALTLIAPLKDFPETDSFQLTYHAAAGGTQRYVYRKGKAIVFGSGFHHSTEPGESQAGEPHTSRGPAFSPGSALRVGASGAVLRFRQGPGKMGLPRKNSVRR